MLDRDTKGHLALGSALVDCLAVAGMTLPQAQALFLVAMDEGRSVSEYAERAGGEVRPRVDDSSRMATVHEALPLRDVAARAEARARDETSTSSSEHVV